MRSRIKYTEPSMAVQADAEAMDINKIIARARATGQWPHTNKKPPVYMDCVGIGDYQASLERVQRAQDAFSALPARVRDRFANSPAKMVEFLSNPANKKEAQDLGLLAPAAESAAAGAARSSAAGSSAAASSTEKGG